MPRRVSPSLGGRRHSPYHSLTIIIHLTYSHSVDTGYVRTGDWRLGGCEDASIGRFLIRCLRTLAHMDATPGRASCGSFWQGRCRITPRIRGTMALKRARARLFSETALQKVPSDQRLILRPLQLERTSVPRLREQATSANGLVPITHVCTSRLRSFDRPMPWWCLPRLSVPRAMHTESVSPIQVSTWFPPPLLHPSLCVSAWRTCFFAGIQRTAGVPYDSQYRIRYVGGH